MGETYYSDGRVTSTPDTALRQQGAAYLSFLRKDIPGVSSTNRFGQANHFNGVVSIAIKARMDLMGSCSFQVLKRRKANRNKSTFGPGSTVAKAVSGPQKQGRDEEYTPFEDHDFPLARMMCRPNPNETQGELAAKLVLQNCLTGVGPLWAVPNSNGRPVELWSLKTPLMYPLWTSSQRFPNGSWKVNPYMPGGWTGSMPMGLGSTGAIIPGEEVKRFMEPHPLIDWDGYSPLTAGAVELDVLRAIDESRKSAMDNGLQLDAVLVAPGMDQAQLQQFVDNMTARHGGSKNARKFGAIAPPAGLTDKATLQTYGASAKDMDYSQGWEQYVKFALALFGVPASVAGLATTTSYSELYAALRQFHHRQSQYIGRFETWYTRILAWPWSSFPDEYLVRVKLPALDDPDMMEKQNSTLIQHDLMTYNETRARYDLDPVEGGDVPISIYVKMQEQKVAPPQPQGNPGDGEKTGTGAGFSPGQPAADAGPTAGAVPTPENAAAEGTGLPTVQKAAPNNLRLVAEALAKLPADDLVGLAVYGHPDGPKVWIDQMDWHEGDGGKVIITVAEKATKTKAIEGHKLKGNIPPGAGVYVFNEGPKPPGTGWVDLLPTVTKAEPCGMGESVGSAGGFVVPADRKKLRRVAKRVVRKALANLGEV